MESIREAGGKFRSLSEPWADTTTHAGKMIMTIFAGIAEFERDLILSEQVQGETSFENNDSIGNRAGYNIEIKSMEEKQGNNTIEERIDRKLREAKIPGCEVEFDPDEAERIAFREYALSDEDARECSGSVKRQKKNKGGR
jgi:DNA invertase Pin-like site-specific DNA recombinase